MQIRSPFAMPEVVKNIIIINVLFLLAKFSVASLGVNLDEVLGLFFFKSAHFRPWQLVSHFFMHGGTMHLLVNMFALWMFGSNLEQLWGPKRFLTFYFVTAAGAFLLQYAVQFVQYVKLKPLVANYDNVLEYGREVLLDPTRAYMDPFDAQMNELLNVPMVGASGAVFGILAAFAMYFPNTRIFLLFPPIPIKAKYFVLFYAIFELYSGVGNFQGDNIAHFAHLGGALFGFLMVKYWNRNNRSSLY